MVYIHFAALCAALRCKAKPICVVRIAGWAFGVEADSTAFAVDAIVAHIEEKLAQGYQPIITWDAYLLTLPRSTSWFWNGCPLEWVRSPAFVPPRSCPTCYS